jgi:hypothetical protein
MEITVPADATELQTKATTEKKKRDKKHNSQS